MARRKKQSSPELPEGVRELTVKVYVHEGDASRMSPLSVTLNTLSPSDIEVANRMRNGQEAMAVNGIKDDFLRNRMKARMSCAMPFYSIIQQVREQLEEEANAS